MSSSQALLWKSSFISLKIQICIRIYWAEMLHIELIQGFCVCSYALWLWYPAALWVDYRICITIHSNGWFLVSKIVQYKVLVAVLWKRFPNWAAKLIIKDVLAFMLLSVSCL